MPGESLPKDQATETPLGSEESSSEVLMRDDILTEAKHRGTCYMPVILALVRLNKEAFEFRVSLGYVTSSRPE